MKKILFKTSLICLTAMLGSCAISAPDPGNMGSAWGGYDPGSIDQSNFIQTQQYKEKVRLH